jgi:hypothetical protein
MGASNEKSPEKTVMAFPWALIPNMNFLAKLNQM